MYAVSNYTCSHATRWTVPVVAVLVFARGEVWHISCRKKLAASHQAVTQTFSNVPKDVDVLVVKNLDCL